MTEPSRRPFMWGDAAETNPVGEAWTIHNPGPDPREPAPWQDKPGPDDMRETDR